MPWRRDVERLLLDHPLLAGFREAIPPARRIPARQRLRRFARPAWLGTLRRTSPLSDEWGYDRGTPIDRYYIEQFLAEHCWDIQGHVLEVRDRRYTERFGIAVERSDILDVNADNPYATLVTDLTAASAIPRDVFDCFVLTQTLQFIYDTRAAIAHAHRILRPGGVLLATLPGVSRIATGRGIVDDYWRFTAASCKLLFEEIFRGGQVTIRAYGNVLAAIGFLTGMAAEELSRRELEVYDAHFPLVIAVRAVKR